MISTKVLTAKSCLCILVPAMAMAAGPAAAAEEALKCRLYIAASMDKEARSSIELKAAKQTLGTMRRASFCVFEDGSVADKQFVFVDRAIGDGSTGSSLGYSVYTMANGDTLSAQFNGAWDSKGFHGTYSILGGSGKYKNATGDGTISGTQSPWDTAAIIDIVLNVKTP